MIKTCNITFLTVIVKL